MSKLILVDCDGVMLDWVKGFEKYMEELGYEKKGADNMYALCEWYQVTEEKIMELIEDFNRSPQVATLEAFPDVFRKMYDFYFRGYKFHILTSMTDNPIGQDYRRENIQKVFGSEMIEDITFFPCGAKKTAAYEKYKGRELFYIEDSPSHADESLEYGLRPLLLRRSYTENYTGPVPMVNDWDEIFHIVTCSEALEVS